MHSSKYGNYHRILVDISRKFARETLYLSYIYHGDFSMSRGFSLAFSFCKYRINWGGILQHIDERTVFLLLFAARDFSFFVFML